MSNLYEYIKMAVHNIMANKGRSFLTMLGIIIGIASVIAIVSVDVYKRQVLMDCQKSEQFSDADHDPDHRGFFHPECCPVWQ